MARDFWQTIRAAVRIDKIKQSLTIPAASYTTFRRHGCLEYDVADNNDNHIIIAENLQAAFTFEFWAKPLSSIGTKQVLVNFGTATQELEISLLGNVLTAKVFKGAVASTITYTSAFSYVWSHFAVTYDGTTFKLFLNGLKVNSVAVAANLDAGAIFCQLVQSQPTQDLFIGRFAELRVWSSARTEEQILSYYRNPRNVGMDDVTNLIHYYKCNGVSVDFSGREQNQVNTVLVMNGSVGKGTTEDSPPLIFGASFAAVEFPVVLTEPVSFQYPNTIPDGCTGMLVVRWIETDGTVQRRRFWDLEGVDIHPFPDIYDGEAIHVPFALEWWNVDGAETIEVPDDITLRISKCTKPTTSYDSTAVSAATLTGDTTLGEPYPLTYPLTFNTAQTYV